MLPAHNSFFHPYVYPPASQENTEALHVEQAITPTCFRICQGIAVQLKDFFVFLVL